MSEKQVWLITGSNRGIGKAIAIGALENGDSVALGSRRPEAVDDLVEKYGDRTLVVPLDMNDPDQVGKAVKQVLDRFGKLDVLVNNAGYGLQGMIEEVSMDQVRAQMETNVFGLIHLTQTAIAPMRAAGSGYIVNISSIAGLRGMAGLGIYNASKFAVEGFSEALAQEVAGFGIRVSVVEPGPYKTDWLGDSLDRSEAMLELKPDSPYYEMNEKMKGFFDQSRGKQPGDPRQIASVLVEASRHPNPPLHMLFGEVAISRWEQYKPLYDDPQHFKYYPHDRTTV